MCVEPMIICEHLYSDQTQSSALPLDLTRFAGFASVGDTCSWSASAAGPPLEDEDRFPRETTYM